MLLGIRDGDDAVREALEYLNAEDGVLAGEVHFDV